MDRRQARPTGRERRSHPRHALEVPAQLCLAGRQLCDARSVEISAGGIGLVVPVSVPPGTTCSVSLTLPTRADGSRRLELQAVAWHGMFSRGGGGFRIGLRLLAVAPHAATAIADLLSGGAAEQLIN